MAIEIRIESVTAKFKLSQNRTAPDQAGVKEHLSQRAMDDGAIAMLKLMQAFQNNK